MESLKTHSVCCSINRVMTRSVNLAKSNIDQEGNKQKIQLKRQNKKLKSDYEQLTQKYQKMKIYHFNQMLNLQKNITEHQTNIMHLNQENSMLKERIKFLEKDNTSNYTSRMLKSTKLNYSKINHSTKPVPSLQKSFKRKNIQKQNHSHNQSLTSQILPINQMIQVQKIPSSPHFLSNDINQSQNCSLLSINEQKFDKKIKNQAAIIKQDCQVQIKKQQYCHHERCIKNYGQLQQLRRRFIQLNKKLQNLYIYLNVAHYQYVNSQQIIDFKMKIQKLSEKSSHKDYQSKIKPNLLIQKINKKIKQFKRGQIILAKDPFDLKKLQNSLKTLKFQTTMYYQEIKELQRNDKSNNNKEKYYQNQNQSYQEEEEQSNMRCSSI